MPVINRAIDLAILFIIGAYLIVPFAASFIGAPNWTQTGISSTLVQGIVIILLITFMFRQVQHHSGKS